MSARPTIAPYTADDGRIRIRPHEASDVEPLFEAVMASKAELMRYLPWCHEGYGIDETRAWVESCPRAWEKGEAYAFVVEGLEGGELLGGVGLQAVQHLLSGGVIGSLGYWTRSDALCTGVATAATRLAAAFGFETFGLQRIEILVKVENHASRRVAAKVGAHFEGLLRARLAHRGVACDAACYSLLPGELPGEGELKRSVASVPGSSEAGEPWPDPA